MQEWISYKEAIHTLVHTVVGDGNLLLNVGPMASGEFPDDQVAVLKKMGKWLKKNGESIYGTRGGPIPNGEWGGMTFKDNKIYVHILNWPEDGSSLILPALDKKIVGSKGLNVKNPVVKQTAEGLEINLPVNKRNGIDSIVILEVNNQP